MINEFLSDSWGWSLVVAEAVIIWFVLTTYKDRIVRWLEEEAARIEVERIKRRVYAQEPWADPK